MFSIYSEDMNKIFCVSSCGLSARDCMALTEKHGQVVRRLSNFLKHFIVDTLYVIGQFHILGISQPIENLFFVVDVAVVVDALTLPEVSDAGWIPETVFLRHQPILHPDDLNSVLRCFVID